MALVIHPRPVDDETDLVLVDIAAAQSVASAGPDNLFETLADQWPRYLLGHIAVEAPRTFLGSPGVPSAVCDGAYRVASSIARRGWGPALYDSALWYVHTKRGPGIIPDRSSVSDQAEAIWAHYRAYRVDVDSRPLEGRCSRWSNMLGASYTAELLDRRYFADASFPFQRYAAARARGDQLVARIAARTRLARDMVSFGIGVGGMAMFTEPGRLDEVAPEMRPGRTG